MAGSKHISSTRYCTITYRWPSRSSGLHWGVLCADHQPDEAYYTLSEKTWWWLGAFLAARIFLTTQRCPTRHPLGYSVPTWWGRAEYRRGNSAPCLETRYVPGFQPPFSLVPDPDQNKKYTSFISVAAYGVYIPLSRPIQFCSLPKRNFEKKCPRSCRSCGTLYPGSEWGFANFHGVQIISSQKSPVI